ncbi:MAG: RDD family protein [Catenulispora sp.]
MTVQVAVVPRRPPAAEPPTPVYAGLVTRAIAFAVDAAIVNLVGLAVGVVVGLALSILNTPSGTDDVLVAIGGVAFVIWTIAYFVAFWSTTGQTPGDRVMRIRVRRAGEESPLRPRWAFVRLVGLCLAAIPLLLGFLPILLNDRRRGLQDFLARSVVVSVPTGHERGWS